MTTDAYRTPIPEGVDVSWPPEPSKGSQDHTGLSGGFWPYQPTCSCPPCRVAADRPISYEEGVEIASRGMRGTINANVHSVAAMRAEREAAANREALMPRVEEFYDAADDAHAERWANAPRPDVLDRARAIVDGERHDEYGGPERNLKAIGEVWGALLDTEPIPPALVALMMGGLKLVRAARGESEDHLIDAAGYTLLAHRSEFGGAA